MSGVRAYEASKVSWTDEHIEILRAGLAAGDSYALIAKRIPSCSRCAAIGKANRLGLAKPTAASQPSHRRSPVPLHQSRAFGASKVPMAGLRAPPVARAVGQNAGLIFKTRKFGDALVAVDASDARPARFSAAGDAFSPLPGSSPRPWTERLSGMCSWPVGGSGAEMLSCCLPVVERGWCSAHVRRGTAPATTRREDKRLGIVPMRKAAHG